MNLPIALDGSTRLYSYAHFAAISFGPLTATVPIAENGFEVNGNPRLFAAQVDPGTGLPLRNSGPGHCFIATSTRINDAQTGLILPQFVFTGPVETGARMDFALEGLPALSATGVVLLAALILAAGLYFSCIHRKGERGAA